MVRHASLIALAVATAVASAGAAASDPRDSVFRDDRQESALVHTASGISFPDELVGFRRTGDAVFDASGSYVGVRYVKPLARGAEVELRIAIVHIIGMTPREHYVIAKPIVLRSVSNVRQIAEGSYTRPDAGAAGYRGVFRGLVGGRQTMVGLWTFDRGYWDLRMRAETPFSSRSQAEQAIGQFVSAFRGLDGSYEAAPAG